MEESFLALSKILTGFEKLNPALAPLYFNKLNETFGKTLADVLQTFSAKIEKSASDAEQLIREDIWSVPDFQLVCQAIINIWYTATLVTNGNTTWVAPPEGYYDALLWKAIEAHPPALSGGYVGYWRYAPEN